jgi:hypothetical protein
MSVHTSVLTLYSSAARTATPTAVEFPMDGRRGLRVVIDVTAIAATPSVVPTIDVYDPVSGKWSTRLTGAAITGTGTTVLTVYPGITATANVSAADVLHGRVRLVLTHADTDSITYTASAHLLP